MDYPSNDQSALEPQASVRRMLERLKQDTETDFLALALYDPEQHEIRWRIAYGASSERYKAIAIRVGKGIAGDVMLSGRPLTVRNFPEDVTSDPMEYPIMIIEKLISCYVAPIKGDGAAFGALMAADRYGRVYGQSLKDAVSRTALSIGKLYAASYEEAGLGRAKPPAGTSPLMNYLKRHISSPAVLAGAEVLDQRITRMPEALQQEIAGWLDRLLELLTTPEGDKLKFSVERREGSWMSLEAEAKGPIEEPGGKLDWLLARAGELQGNVEMYCEPDRFLVRINLPVGLMAEDTPWVF